MKLEELKDLEGRNCIVVEMSKGIAVKLLCFFEEGGMIKANLEYISKNGFSYNKVRLHGEPWFKEWWVTNHGSGKIIDISTRPDEIYRDGDYLYFGVSWGGPRLFFSDQLVNKVIRKEEDGIEDLILEFVT